MIRRIARAYLAQAALTAGHVNTRAQGTPRRPFLGCWRDVIGYFAALPLKVVAFRCLPRRLPRETAVQTTGSPMERCTILASQQ